MEEERASLLADVRDVDFPLAMRGYDRAAVGAYMERVNRVVAELEATRSPQAAVRRALDRVGEETSSILQRANETAEEIATRSRAQADDRFQEAERDAHRIREEAEARVREVEGELEALWQERARLVEETRGLGDRLHSVADEAAHLNGEFPQEPQFVDQETAEVPLLPEPEPEPEPRSDQEPEGDWQPEHPSDEPPGPPLPPDRP